MVCWLIQQKIIRFIYPGKTKVAFFNQDLLSYQTGKSAVEVAREAFSDQLTLKEEIDRLLEKIESGDANTDLWDSLAAKQAEFETRGGPGIDGSRSWSFIRIGLYC